MFLSATLGSAVAQTAPNACCSIDLLLIKNKSKDATQYYVTGYDPHFTRQTQSLERSDTTLVTGDFGSCVLVSALSTDGKGKDRVQLRVEVVLPIQPQKSGDDR